MDSILSSPSRSRARNGRLAFPILFTADDTRRDRLLLDICNAAIAFVLPLSALFIIILFTNYSWQTALAMALVVLLSVAALLARRLAAHGASRAASRLFLSSHVLVIIANAWLVDGLADVIAAPLIVFIVTAGMVMGAGAAIRFSLIGGGLWLFTQTLLRLNLIVPTSLPGLAAELVAAAVIVSTFIYVAVVAKLSAGSCRRSLHDATMKLVEENQRLERANSLKTLFTARTSHELRTPLGAITVFADLMLRQAYGPLTPKQKDSLERVLRSAKRLNELMDDILDLSRIEAGELEIVNRRLSLTTLVDNVSALFKPIAGEKDLALSIHISPEMPDSIVGDERRLTQVLVNLIDNAIKYTAEGGVSATIEPLYSTHFRLTVRDTGRGIHEESQERVFRPFQRESLSESVDKAPGTGLGLSITRHLVDMMGGRIHLESVVGQGSTFEVILPLRLKESGTGGEEPSGGGDYAAGTGFSGRPTGMSL